VEVALLSRNGTLRQFRPTTILAGVDERRLLVNIDCRGLGVRKAPGARPVACHYKTQSRYVNSGERMTCKDDFVSA
jgi:hypothetical protein